MVQTTEGLDAAYAKIALLADNAWHYNNDDPYILAHQVVKSNPQMSTINIELCLTFGRIFG